MLALGRALYQHSRSEAKKDFEYTYKGSKVEGIWNDVMQTEDIYRELMISVLT